MATTEYTVSTIDAEGVATPVKTEKPITKKAKAVELAEAKRDETKLAVQVTTQTGTVVFEQAAPRKINMIKPFTRVVELPEGTVVPEGMRAAYPRFRKGLVLLHDPSDAETPYVFMVVHSSELLHERFATSRDAGQAVKDYPSYKPAPAEVEAEEAPEELDAETEEDTSEVEEQELQDA
jgi:hypothetical protein